MRTKLLTRRAFEEARENGVREAARKSVNYAVNFVKAGFKYSGYQDRRVDIDYRWELFVPHLSEEDSVLLDIGCAEGMLTKKFAEEGMLSIGIDVQEVRLDEALKRHHMEERLAFMNHRVTPDNVSDLPAVDVVLLLAVYHHWCKHYDDKMARGMLKELGRKTNKLFFEAPEKRVDTDLLENTDHETLVSYYMSYLNTVYREEVNVSHLGKAERMGGEERHVFFINTKQV